MPDRVEPLNFLSSSNLPASTDSRLPIAELVDLSEEYILGNSKSEGRLNSSREYLYLNTFEDMHSLYQLATFKSFLSSGYGEVFAHQQAVNISERVRAYYWRDASLIVTPAMSNFKSTQERIFASASDENPYLD